MRDTNEQSLLLHRMPDELLILVFTFLIFPDAVRFASASKRLHSIVHDKQLASLYQQQLLGTLAYKNDTAYQSLIELMRLATLHLGRQATAALVNLNYETCSFVSTTNLHKLTHTPNSPPALQQLLPTQHARHTYRRSHDEHVQYSAATLSCLTSAAPEFFTADDYENILTGLQASLTLVMTTNSPPHLKETLVQIPLYLLQHILNNTAAITHKIRIPKDTVYTALNMPHNKYFLIIFSPQPKTIP